MPVQQHPIPQNVTQFQFRLVGDMTLKQFLELAGGVVIALIFYASPLPFFIKWPFIIIFVALGGSMAFLPIEGRPLEQWILAFFRSIYSPTIYTWQKEGTDFSGITQSQNTAPLTQQPAPTVSTPSITNLPVVTESVPLTMNINTDTPTPITETKTPSQPATIYSHKPKEVSAIPSQTIKIEKHFVTQQTQEKHQQPTPLPMVNTPSPTPITTTSPTTFASTLPIPHPPQTPNTIVGMTITNDDKIMDSTIVEILKDGLTIRATKSNKLGQFLFAKPLENGDYQLTAEKEGHTFPVFNLKLDNNVIPPIQLKSQN